MGYLLAKTPSVYCYATAWIQLSSRSFYFKNGSNLLHDLKTSTIVHDIELFFFTIINSWPSVDAYYCFIIPPKARFILFVKPSSHSYYFWNYTIYLNMHSTAQLFIKHFVIPSFFCNHTRLLRQLFFLCLYKEADQYKLEKDAL